MSFSNYKIDMTVIDILDSQLNYLYLTSTSFWYILLTSYISIRGLPKHFDDLAEFPLLLFLKRGYIGLILIYSIFKAIISSLVTENIKRVAGLVFIFSLT